MKINSNLLLDRKKILITGTAGFIGYHLSKYLSEKKFDVVGIDSVNDYYDQQLKIDRLKDNGIILDEFGQTCGIISSKYSNYKFYHASIDDQFTLEEIFKIEKPIIVINLAAQAGVRYSLTHPRDYIKSNINGFINILECCRSNNIRHLIYASSSSVYGLNSKIPFRTIDSVDHPISIYAATKKSNELMAHTYSYLFGLPTTGLRFFTVYGPWGRPDMAYFNFTKSILHNEVIKLYSNGEMYRDYTYIDDIIRSIYLLIDKHPVCSTDHNLLANPAKSVAPYQVLNIGNNKPILLKDFVNELELILNKKAIVEYLPMQPGDVKNTHADTEDLNLLIDFKPNTKITDGLSRFVDWYKGYYKI